MTTTITLPRATVEQALEALEQYIAKELTVGQRYTNEGQRLLDTVTSFRAALAQQAEPLTIYRLRDALVASRIIPPAAVEDPEGYDDGVTLHRIQGLHRRIT